MTNEKRSITAKFCDERHRALDIQVEDLKGWIEKVDGKLWSGLTLLVLQLLGIILILARGLL